MKTKGDFDLRLLRPRRHGFRTNVHQILTIVHHAELDRGTLHAIYRQALRFIPESELRPYFYSQ